ncbi:hypothetical protein [Brucella intermedia]|uniref:Head-tail adaptor protein n=1 Tax=Brucella intermedia M86 TaxID=1234597 RepID=M5JU79_9HYPH|nr:hypothetical protein [Brucella intermedia]ELT46836.1 hypothetical protein D584_22656 [Brucella intermedia M86]
MAGLLDTDDIQQLFGDIFSDIYGDGQLITVTMVRGPGGVQIPQESSVPCKVQVDRADESMRQSAGYTDTDVKLIILQSGLSDKEPDSDSIVVAQGRRWKVSGVRSDPARAAWIMRGIRQASE